MNKVEIHRNAFQLENLVVRANTTMNIVGRAGGKGSGAQSDFAYRNVMRMPRANGGLYMQTYTELLLKLIPGIIEGWEGIGFNENLHWVIGKKPTKAQRFEDPYVYPRGMHKHFMHIKNGSGIHLISGDRSVTNGFNLAWAGIDEWRFQNEKKLTEFLYTVRGYEKYYGDMPDCNSTLFTTDMPKEADQRWILKMARKASTPDMVQEIIDGEFALLELKEKLYTCSKSYKAKLTTRINRLDKALNVLRMKCVHVSYYSSLVNIDVIGIDRFENWKRSMSEFDFAASILNKEVLGTKNGFYASLDEKAHGYFKENYDYIDGQEIEMNIKDDTLRKRDCRWDGDINTNQPLSIALDYNNNINSLVTEQSRDKVISLKADMYVLGEHKMYLKALIKKWCAYYQYHKCKTVHYYYDHTAKPGDATGRTKFYQDVIQHLTDGGWDVQPHFVGQSSTHHKRYYELQKLFVGEMDDYPSFEFNRGNCRDWYHSCKHAPVKRVGDQIKKDKKSEHRDSKVPPQEATHLSEAGDTMLMAKIMEHISGLGGFTPTIGM